MLLVCAVMMVGWGVFSYGFLASAPRGGPVVALLLVSPIAVLVLAVSGWVRRDRWWPWVVGQLDRHTTAVDAVPAARLGWAVAAAAGLGLFAELMIIRLHSSYFQVFAYFKNVSLLSCFLGLGIGYTLAGRKRLLTPFVLPALALQILYMHAIDLTQVASGLQNPVSEELAFGAMPAEAAALPSIYGFFILVFGFNALTFVPLGQLASRLMSRMTPLVSYGWNLGGSLAGIGVFYLLAALWAPPALWVAAAAVTLLAFVRAPRAVLVSSAVAGLLVVSALSLPKRLYEVEVYSPYQLLTLSLNRGALPVLEVSHVYYQNAMNLDSAAIEGDTGVQRVQRYYDLPYTLQPHPRRVLVVGAGLGNDVAAALRAGADAVDAVEIDPAILEFGQLLHPEAPYQDPRVRPTVQDARAFIRHAPGEYDLIVYGLLDSHSLLSSKAGVRLDSYVYTVEAFREARAHLADGGLISLTFSLMTRELGTKLYRMMTEAFDGAPPTVYRTHYNFGFAFIAGADITSRRLAVPSGLEDVTSLFSGNEIDVDVSTDDWPFLYMPVRKYPASYALMIVILLAMSLLLIEKTTSRAARGMSWPCFFLGAGFMLIETKSITELALVYGSTWTVIGATIAAILVLAFAANWIVARRGAVSRPVTYGLLLLSILGGLFLTSSRLIALPPALGAVLLTGALTLPLFFSGFAFSTELKLGTPVAIALSSNLLGAMLGGFLEYNSMYFGFDALYYLAFGLYALAWLTSMRGSARVADALAPATA